MEEQTQVIKELSMPLYQSKGWLKLLGIVMIIQGVFTALTLVGIVIAWLPIWLGVLLFQAASAAESAQFSGNKEQLMASLNKLKMYFIINGVLMVILLLFVAFLVLSMLIAGGSFLNQMGGY
ncbi:MAG: DUF5362 family protein [Candidatus Zixiibacteriota bacterium]